MIAITKEEKEVIEDVFPFVKIIRTKKQKSKRHLYYAEENPEVKAYLADMRDSKVRGDWDRSKRSPKNVKPFDKKKFYTNNYKGGKAKGNGKKNWGGKRDWK